MISVEKKARAYRKAANLTTIGRTYISAVVSANITTGDRLLPKTVRHRSVGLAVGIAALAGLDKLDGYFACKAEAYGLPPTDEDKKLDPKHDKLFAYMTMGSIAMREIMDGNKLYGGMIAGNALIACVRDRKMNQSRENAVQGADVGAIWINKQKTGVQNFGHVIAGSPLAATMPGQALAVGIYGVSNVMGIVGYFRADKIHRGEDNG